MIQSGDRFRFELEAGDLFLRHGKIFGKKLQGHITVKFQVTGSVDDPHAPFAQFSDDSVVGNRLTDEGSHAVPSRRLRLAFYAGYGLIEVGPTGGRTGRGPRPHGTSTLGLLPELRRRRNSKGLGSNRPCGNTRGSLQPTPGPS